MSRLRRHLYILDVGQGSCAVVVGDAEVVVVDVGRRSGLLEFLDQQCIRRIRTIYLSHADGDHIGALVGLLTSGTVTIDRVVLNSDALRDTKVWNDLVYKLDSAHMADTLQLDVDLVSGKSENFGDIEVQVMAPSRYLTLKGVGSKNGSGRRITSNSISAVVRISVSGKHVAILPADIDGIGLDDLLKRDIDLRASILVYPHHGGRPGSADISSFTERLLEAVEPTTVVFSFGRGHYGLPNPEIISVLRKNMPNVRIVCTQLSEHCSKTEPSGSMSHLSSAYALGRVDHRCCGGTIVVPLDNACDLEPGQDDHINFIRSNVETPLCLGDLDSMQ